MYVDVIEREMGGNLAADSQGSGVISANGQVDRLEADPRRQACRHTVLGGNGGSMRRNSIRDLSTAKGFPVRRADGSFE